MSKSKYENLQSSLMSFIPEACFFISLLSVADDYNTDYNTGMTFDFIDAYRKALSEGWLGLDNVMYNDVALLKWLTGVKVNKDVITGTKYDVAPNQYTIAKYQYKQQTHFRRRGYDVYSNSNTVKNGKCIAIYRYTFN